MAAVLVVLEDPQYLSSTDMSETLQGWGFRVEMTFEMSESDYTHLSHEMLLQVAEGLTFEMFICPCVTGASEGVIIKRIALV